MKTLHLIRHAKSSWGNASLADVERPLNKRGEEACQLMAEHIRNAGCNFSHVYCSMAKRARLTLEGLSQALPGMAIEWTVEESLYTFSHQSLLAWCLDLPDNLDEVVLVGHNPALTRFCNEMGDRLVDNLPTCGYAQLRFPIHSWEHLTPGGGKTVTLLTPGMLR